MDPRPLATPVPADSQGTGRPSWGERRAPGAVPSRPHPAGAPPPQSPGAPAGPWPATSHACSAAQTTNQIHLPDRPKLRADPFPDMRGPLVVPWGVSCPSFPALTAELAHAERVTRTTKARPARRENPTRTSRKPDSHVAKAGLAHHESPTRTPRKPDPHVAKARLAHHESPTRTPRKPDPHVAKARLARRESRTRAARKPDSCARRAHHPRLRRVVDISRRCCYGCRRDCRVGEQP